MSEHELAAAYAVDAVDDVERARFERHLTSCPTCADEVRSLREVTAVLATSTAVSAPASLRSSVMSAIAATPQVELPRAGVQAPGEKGHSAPRTTRRTPWLAVAASVMAVAAVALGALFVQAAQQRDELSSDLTAVQEVLTAPDAQTISGDVGDGRASVVTSSSLERAVFVGSGLDSAPSGETYQLWVIDPDGAATSAGIFEPGSDGDVTRVMQAVPTTGDTIGLTLEPDGGSEAPTTNPILAVPVA